MTWAGHPPRLSPQPPIPSVARSPLDDRPPGPSGALHQPSRCRASVQLAGWSVPANGRQMSRPVRRVLSRTVIHLGRPLPDGSSDLPVRSGGPPSNAHCLVLLRVGFTEPRQSPGVLVVSYTHRFTLTRRRPAPKDRARRAVCFLWHCPAGHPGWPLATTLPCGARTFLGGRPYRRAAGGDCRRDRPADSSAGA